jgi:predicted outer membrane repeat protein
MKHKVLIVFSLLCGCLLLCAARTPSRAAGVLHVKPSASGSGNCGDWDNACTLQTALASATAGDEIWVAAGTYTPGTNREDSFQLKSDVAVYGGFAGTETDRSQRDWAANATVLSGDLDGNDFTNAQGVVTDTANITGTNAYHVVTGSGTDATAVLDGFTVTAGNANGGYPNDRGGGMYNDGGSPTVRYVTFSGNYGGSWGGGGMENYRNSSPTLVDVTFSGNSADFGGGMDNSDNSSPTLTNVTFSGNSADYGGGMYNYYSNTSPTLTNVTFSGNAAVYGGGGMYNGWNSSSTLTNVTFSGNAANYGGGMCNEDSLKSPVVVYGGFAGTETGRSQRDWVANATVLSGDLDGNDVTNAQGVVTGSGTDATAVLDGFTVSAGNASGGYPNDRGGGMYNDGGSPTLTNVTFSGNSAVYDGGMGNYNSSPTLTNVTFSGNSANIGGGMGNWDNSSPTLTNVTFSGNYAYVGGGMGNWDNSSPTLTNVTFSGNATLYDGGGMYNYNSSPTLVNVTFSGNSASSYGGGMYSEWDSSATLTNCILWGNTDGGTLEQSAQIFNAPGSAITVTYSLVAGGVYTGSGNITGDPQFVRNPDAGDGDWTTPGDNDYGDLRLQLTSPAVDAGDNRAVPADTLDLDGDGDTAEKLPFDVYGYPRFVDVPSVADTGVGTPPIVDMGACEAQTLIYLPLVVKSGP